ncbi:cobinamide kinase [Bacillus lacus]|uniref:Adenosylcobinamide kinase n=1 Tax=Metabacillus lacus TaxID=1983721 RepID=A0A7X2IZD6_9BACI|nr:bifunctional adenosylcobinamide kinase/adenosylcobinamide-phosphate guanylyltransferase [Metabacillus lacus]MRX72505.1 cobinamide kinase [Metabacillus lacus]
MDEHHTIIFISGGVRSGKSRFAEELAIQKAAKHGGCLHYIAPGTPSDDEMKSRIQKHQADRMRSGQSWKTWEQHRSLHLLSGNFDRSDVVLLDCLTTLVNNELFHSAKEEWNADQLEEIKHSILSAAVMLSRECSTLILVSNEVFFDTVQNSTLVYAYMKLLGELHQEIVKEARDAYLVEAGIAMKMKGGRQAWQLDCM